jgi:hypothetical protein
MSEIKQKGIAKPDALVFALYRGTESAMQALKEYQENQGKVPIATTDVDSFLKSLVESYIEKLPLKEKLVIKSLLILPWSDTVKFASDFALGLGKNENDYKTTSEVLLNSLKKYVGA